MYTLRQGRIGSNGNEEVLYILHNTRTEASIHYMVKFTFFCSCFLRVFFCMQSY